MWEVHTWKNDIVIANLEAKNGLRKGITKSIMASETEKQYEWDIMDLYIYIYLKYSNIYANIYMCTKKKNSSNEYLWAAILVNSFLVSTLLYIIPYYILLYINCLLWCSEINIVRHFSKDALTNRDYILLIEARLL